jgi:hypothetical protein
MSQASGTSELVVENGMAVLMARIVDSAGVAVHRDQVAFAAYSILELADRDRSQEIAVPSHEAVRVDVDQVFCDSLEVGGLWDVDVVGYNFRHEINANRGEPFPKLGATYEIRYTLLPIDRDEAEIIRFRVKANKK